MVTYPLEMLWKDDAVISASQRVTKPNGADGHAWAPLWEGKCKLSFFNNLTSNNAVRNSGIASEPKLVAKLFLPKDVIIPAGCRVDVTHEGASYQLKSSGVPAVFSHHQEILLEVAQEWA